jgi:hypothetical protein
MVREPVELDFVNSFTKIQAPRAKGREGIARLQTVHDYY